MNWASKLHNESGLTGYAVGSFLTLVKMLRTSQLAENPI